MSKWLEAPLKVTNALNTLFYSLYERYDIVNRSFSSSIISTPVLKDESRHYNFFRIRNLISSLLLYVFVDAVDEWCKAYPYRYLGNKIDDKIADLLRQGGFDPNWYFFDKKPPYRYADSAFFEAAYYLINNHLKYILPNYSCNQYYTTYIKYFAGQGESRYDENRGISRDIAQSYLDVYGGAIGEKFHSGKMILQAYYDYPNLTKLSGDWKMKIPITLSDGDREFNYEQIIDFDGMEAGFPTLAGNYADIDYYFNYAAKNQVDSSVLREYLPASSFDADFFFDEQKIEIKVSDSNFQFLNDMKYLDVD